MSKLSVAIVALLALLVAYPSVAQDCNVSFNVKPEKSVTVLNFGAGPGESVTMTMSCLTAETMRQRMFISGQALDPALLEDAAKLRDKITEVNTALATKKKALSDAKDKAQRQLALKTVQSFALAGTVIVATAACVAGGVVPCVGLVGAGAAIFAFGETAATSAGDLVVEAQKASADIDILSKGLSELQGKLQQNQTSQYKLRYNPMYTALCDVVRNQCL